MSWIGPWRRDGLTRRWIRPFRVDANEIRWTWGPRFEERI